MIHFPQRKERKEKRELKVSHILISSHIPSFHLFPLRFFHL